ncbi:hypothetical protein QAD02_018792 [Eretmocerus hayati]|uniref:Uncharacterized protein n=1 Tax=Eretmocerus hayati TaxID=131215 RepID=A0ACC2PHU4_9HYME|nr:hypothetical protein QAD02_018792 [Eretmocerus hayati]
MEKDIQVKTEPKEEQTELEPQNDENIVRERDSPPAKRNNITSSKTLNTFFELFYDGPYNLTLSNRSWGIHRVREPLRAIILSEITCSLTSSSMLPSYKKQVILTENLKFIAFVLDRLVVERNLDPDNSKEDFENSFAEIVNLPVCRGGPTLVDNFGILSRWAHKDMCNQWRHKSCTILIEKGEICSPCACLDKYYQEWARFSLKDK